MRIMHLLLFLAITAAFAKDPKPPALDQKALTEIARAEALAFHAETQLALAKGPYDAAVQALRQKVAAQDAVCKKAGMAFSEPELACVAPPPSVVPPPSPVLKPDDGPTIPANNPPPAPMPKK